MKQRIHRSQDGFTLVEIIVSIAILSIVCVVFLKLFTLANQVSSNAGEVDQASLHASNVLELLKSQETLVPKELAAPYNELKQNDLDPTMWTLYFDEAWIPIQAENACKYKLLVTIAPSEMQMPENEKTDLEHIKVEVLKKQDTKEVDKLLVLYETDQRTMATHLSELNTSAE